MSDTLGHAIDRGKALRSTAWSAVENGGLTVISFLSLILFSRLLSPTDFGLFAMALAIVDLLGLFANMSFHDALVQRRDVSEEDFDSAFCASLVISLLLVIGCWLAAPLFTWSSGNPKAGLVLSILSLGFLFSGSAATLTARARREFAFRTLALRSLVGRVIGAALGLIAAFAGAGIWSLVIQQLLMQFCGSLALWITTRHRPRLRLSFRHLGRLAQFGAVAISALFTNFAIKRTLIFCAGYFLGTSTAGFVNLAFRMIDTFWTVAVTSIAQVFLPIMARLQDDHDRLRRAYRSAVSLACTVLYAIFVGLAAIAPEAVTILFGPQWTPSANFVTWLGLLVILQAPRLFISPLLTSLGRPQLVLLGYLVGLAYLLIAITATRLTTPAMVMMVWAGSELLYLPLFGFILWKAAGLSIRDQFSCTWSPLLAATGMFAAVTLVRSYLIGELFPVARLPFLIGTGAIAYLGILATINRPLFFETFSLVQQLVLRKRAGSGSTAASGSQ